MKKMVVRNLQTDNLRFLLAWLQTTTRFKHAAHNNENLTYLISNYTTYSFISSYITYIIHYNNNIYKYINKHLYKYIYKYFSSIS